MQNKLVKFVFIILLGINSTFAAFVASVSIEKACPNAVTISWIGTAGRGFNIYRSGLLLNIGTFIGSVGPTVNRATDDNVTPGQTYYYYIEAVDNSASDTSLIAATARVPLSLRKPLSPTTKLTKDNFIEIDWTYLDNEDGVNIYRSTDLGTFNLVKEIASSFTSTWIDNTVVPGHSYSYKITGYDKCGESEPSLSSTTLSVPSLPDLVIDSVKVLTSNDTIYGRFIVANVGNATAIPSFKVIVMCNNNIVSSWNTIGNLLSGYYNSYNFIYKTNKLLNNIILSVDNSDVITESNELNNIFIDTVICAISNVRKQNPHKDIFGLAVCKTNLIIGLNGGSHFNVNIYDITGKHLFKTGGVSAYGKIHINTNLPSNTYIFKLIEGSRSITQKVTLTN